MRGSLTLLPAFSVTPRRDTRPVFPHCLSSAQACLEKLLQLMKIDEGPTRDYGPEYRDAQSHHCQIHRKVQNRTGKAPTSTSSAHSFSNSSALACLRLGQGQLAAQHGPISCVTLVPFRHPRMGAYTILFGGPTRQLFIGNRLWQE